MYKDKKFHVRKMEDIFEDIEMAGKVYGRIKRVFLADGDALCLVTHKILAILDKIREVFPECERITSYGSAGDVTAKTPEELKTLRDHGLEMIYIGAESGDDRVLKDICKDATREELITAVRKIEDSGIKASVTFISGLAGRSGWRDHAEKTGTMISEMDPSYVGLLTLMTEPSAPITKDIAEGKFELLTPEEVIAETLLLMKNINVSRPCVFRSNHASNYFSLRGVLPDDRERMISELEAAAKNIGMLKDERFRML